MNLSILLLYIFPGVAGANIGITGVGRGRGRRSLDNNNNYYNNDVFPSGPTFELISEDLKELKI